MSKKHPGKGKSKKQRGAGQRNDQPAKMAAPQESRTRRVTPMTLGLGLAVVVLGAALIWGWLRTNGGNAAPPRSGGSATLPSAFGPTATNPAYVALQPAPPGTKEPINNYDPITGEAINATSPEMSYKGYVIAFCCASSPGYNGRWAAMSEAAKDAFVRSFLE